MRVWMPEKHTKEELVLIIEDIKRVFSEEDYPSQKLLCEFENEVLLHHNKNKCEMEKSAALSFFIGNKVKAPCYSCRINPRHGYYVSEEMIKNLRSITAFTRDELYPEKKVERFLKKFHPNLWEDLVKELEEDPSLMKTKYYDNYNTVSITQKFPKDVLEELKYAFDNKQNFSYQKNGTKRDLKLIAKLDEETGIYRAWFHSEYSGWCNGSYYILINPTTAALREDD